MPDECVAIKVTEEQQATLIALVRSYGDLGEEGPLDQILRAVFDGLPASAVKP